MFRRRRTLQAALALLLAAALLWRLSAAPAAVPDCADAPRPGSWAVGAFAGDSPAALQPVGGSCSVNPVLGRAAAAAALDGTGRPVLGVDQPTLLPWDRTAFGFVRVHTEDWAGRPKTLLAAAALGKGGRWRLDGIALEEAGNVTAPCALRLAGGAFALLAVEGALHRAAAADVPYGWERVGTLPAGREPALVAADGRVFVFLSRPDGLHLFFTRSEVELDEFLPHPQNPVVPAGGWRSLHRSAGAVVDWDGHLVRLAHGGSGYVVGAHVTKLDVFEYAEEPVSRFGSAMLQPRQPWEAGGQGRVAAVKVGGGWVGLASGWGG